MATGFEVTSFLAPMNIIGKTDTSLEEQWDMYRGSQDHIAPLSTTAATCHVVVAPTGSLSPRDLERILTRERLGQNTFPALNSVIHAFTSRPSTSPKFSSSQSWTITLPMSKSTPMVRGGSPGVSTTNCPSRPSPSGKQLLHQKGRAQLGGMARPGLGALGDYVLGVEELCDGGQVGLLASPGGRGGSVVPHVVYCAGCFGCCCGKAPKVVGISPRVRSCNI